MQIHFIKIDKDKYLCIGVNTDWQDSYFPGEVYDDMEDYCIEGCLEDEYDISIENKEKIYQTIRGIGISFYA